MKKIGLYDKSEEIYNKLNPKYAEIIFNSIIAKSISNGIFLKEASIFLNTEDLKEIANSLDVEFKEKKETNISFSKEEALNRKKEEKTLNIFKGFN